MRWWVSFFWVKKATGEPFSRYDKDIICAMARHIGVGIAQRNLMAELEKMKRVAGREVEGAPHETLLVVDAVTGQNGLEQARQFLKVAGVTGIVLTKLDGTAKGGIAVAIANELNLPIRYAGIGEKVDDLVVFDPEQYVNGLFE